MTVHTISGVTLDLDPGLVKKIFKDDLCNTVIAHSEFARLTVKESVSQIKNMMRMEFDQRQLKLNL